MAFINRFPQGLLGLLDLKTQGENPSQLGPVVTPVIELADLYALNSRGSNSQNSTLTGLGVTAGAYSNLVVPQGELWVVYNLTAELGTPPLGAGATIAAAVGYVPTDNNRFIAMSPMCATIATGADFIAQFQGAFILQPGDSPQVFLTVLTGGNVGVRLTLLRSRFVI
jgi:hypothetical protein